MADSRRRVAVLVTAALVAVAGCDASDNTIDPHDLTMRDLLGFEPEVAAHWDAAQRAAARDVLGRGLEGAPAPGDGALGLGVALDERVSFALGDLDVARAAHGDGALGFVHVDVGDAAVAVDAVPVTLDETTSTPVALEAAPGWSDGDPMLVRGAALLQALAIDAGHDGGTLVVVRAPRLAVAAAYLDAVPVGRRAGADGRPHLLVNPVLLAALDPADDAAATGASNGGAAVAIDFARTRAPDSGGPSDPTARPPVAAPPAPDLANPYSFYGSIAECAYAEQLRCEACRPSNSCEARTVGSDGNSECDAFAANANAGYTLWCINEALAIGGVSDCVKQDAGSCAQDVQAVQTIASLSANMDFVTDTTCAMTLDQCLADIYGPSTGTYPNQGGTDAPRDTSVGCTDTSSPNCNFDPTCNTSGPSCNNSASCSGSCANSASQNGCGANCTSCSSDSGSTSGGGCSSCSSGSSSGSSSGGSCSSCSSGSSSGGSGGSCSSCSSGSSSGGSSGCSSGSGGSCGGSGGSCGGSGGSCGGSGGSCGGSGGSCGGGGGNNNCSVTRAPERVPPVGLLLQVVWALIPVPLAVRARRRAKKKKQARDEGVQP